MNCPTCIDTILQVTDRSGIEIDYCPKCRGVWLDRGELDKVIERSARIERDFDRDDDDDDDYRRRSPDGGPPPLPGSRQQRRRSFWTELFD